MSPAVSSVPLPVSGDPRRWRALAVLALVQFMLILDVTVVNIALPDIKSGLGFSTAGLVWVVDGYTLTAGGLLLLGGRLADLLGRKRMFLLGVGLFTVASVLSGAAQDPAMLVVSRFVQGGGEAHWPARPRSGWWRCYSRAARSARPRSASSAVSPVSAERSDPS